MWNVGIQRVGIHSDNNRFRNDKMVDVIKFSKKSLVSDIKLGILCRRGWRMESTYPEICSVSVVYDRTIGLYGGFMFRLLDLSISCVVLNKLPSVMCLLVLVDMRWLSLSSFGKA